MPQCLSERDFERLQSGSLSAAERSAAQEHLQSCPACTSRLEDFRRRAEQLLDGLRGLRDAVPPPDPDATRSASDTATTDPPAERGDVDVPRDLIPGYELIRRISRGGQGVVYLAVQKGTRRRVAIKLLRSGVLADQSERSRFEREAQVLGQLKHPHIVAVHASGEVRGLQYLVMDYVSGQSLDEYASSRPVNVRGLVEMFVTICQAVDAAHRSGVVHRDLKPSNIRVDHEGQAHVLDFGLAKVALGIGSDASSPAVVSVTGQFIGSLPWASPEQAEGQPEKVDQRTDVYALGVILYQLLTGEFPYRVVGQMRDVLENILHAEPARPSTVRRQVSHELETIVLKCLAKERERRYQNAGELARDLSRFLSGEPIEAKRDSAWYVMRKAVARRRGVLVPAALIGLVALLLGSAWLRSAVQARRHEEKRTATEQDLARSSADLAAANERLAQQADQALRAEYEASINVPPEVMQPPDANALNPDAAIRLNLWSRPRNYNPLDARTDADAIFTELLFDRLFHRGRRHDLFPNSALVAEVIEPPDGLSCTVRLNPAARWHDGAPVTAADVVFSWRLASAVSPRPEQLARLVEASAENDHTVAFRFDAAHAAQRFTLNFEILPSHLLANASTVGKFDPTAALKRLFDWTQPIGSGPFRFERADAEEIVLRRFGDYPGERPRVDRLVLRWLPYGKPETLAAFRAGELDVCELSDEQYSEALGSDEFLKVGRAAHHPDGTITSIIWNCREGSPFADAAVRRALASAINGRRIIDAVLRNKTAPCLGPWPIDSPWFNLSIRRFSFDLENAKRGLTDAGWDVGADDQRGRSGLAGSGKPLAFKLMLSVSSPRERAAAEIIAADLEKIGVHVTLDARPREEVKAAREAGDFEAVFNSKIMSADPRLDAILYVKNGMQNYGKYSNAEVDKLFREAEVARTEPERAAVYQKIHELIYQDQPASFLYYKPMLLAVNRRVHGVEFSTRGLMLFRPGVVRWWVER